MAVESMVWVVRPRPAVRVTRSVGVSRTLADPSGTRTLRARVDAAVPARRAPRRVATETTPPSPAFLERFACGSLRPDASDLYSLFASRIASDLLLFEDCALYDHIFMTCYVAYAKMT